MNKFQPRNIKQKRKPSQVINLYPERDVLMYHTNNIATSKPNVLQTVPGNSSFSSVTKYGKKIGVIGYSHLNRIKKNKKWTLLILINLQ